MNSLCSYRDPTQVPLGEKPKACWDTPVKGTRQNSSRIIGRPALPLYTTVSYPSSLSHFAKPVREASVINFGWAVMEKVRVFSCVLQSWGAPRGLSVPCADP